MSRFIFFLSLFFVACSPDALSDKEKATIVSEARETLNNYYRDINRSGLTAEFKWLDSSAEFFWVPPGYTGPISYDSIASAIRINASRYKHLENSFDTLRITPLGRDLASYSGRIQSVMTDTSGNVFRFVLVETGTLIKRKEGWRLLNGQTSVVSQQ